MGRVCCSPCRRAAAAAAAKPYVSVFLQKRDRRWRMFAYMLEDRLGRRAGGGGEIQTKLLVAVVDVAGECASVRQTPTKLLHVTLTSCAHKFNFWEGA